MKNIFFIWLSILFILPSASAFAGTINIKMEVANPSDSESKTLPIKTYLPKGVGLQDVVDKGGFTIAYDFEKSLYFAYQEVTLKPKETLMLRLGIQDIWVIAPGEVNALNAHTQDLMQTLKKTEYGPQSQTVALEILDNLQRIVVMQAQEGLSIEQRISNFEISTSLLKQARKDIGILEDMLISNGSGEKPMSVLMGDNNLNMDPSSEDIKKLGILHFRIEVSNTDDETKEIPLKYYMPIEVKPEFILNKGGLEVAYDYQKGLYYLKKPGLILESGKSQTFVVEVKDLWVIAEFKVELVRKRTEKMMMILEVSPYKDTAIFLRNRIILVLDGIISSQHNKTISVENHIGQYRLNLQKFDDALKDLAKLEKLAVQAGNETTASKRLTAAPLEKGEKIVEGLRGGRGLDLIGKTIFKGKAPDLATTWKIIWTILIFLGTLSFLFFILWWRQEKKSQGKKYKNVQDNDPQS